MKNIIIVITIIAGLLIFTTREDDIEYTHTNSMESPAPKKTSFDTPTHTYKREVEALSISNTLQKPVNTYLDGRVDAIGNSRKSVNEGNKRMEEQDKAMEAFLK
jgi:hypothetical protein